MGAVVPAVPKDHATGSASACHACCTCVRGVRDLCGVWLNHTHTHARAQPLPWLSFAVCRHIDIAPVPSGGAAMADEEEDEEEDV